MRPHIIQDHTAQLARTNELQKARAMLAAITMREPSGVSDDEAEAFHPFVMLAEHMIKQSPDPAPAYAIAAVTSTVVGMVISENLDEKGIPEASRAFAKSCENLFVLFAENLFKQRRKEAEALARQKTLA